MDDQGKGPTRREFLKGSAAAVAALGLGQFGVFTEARGETIGPNEVINAAIIGPGDHGRGLLNRGIKIPNVKWVACCDIQEKNLKRALEIAKGAEGYDDYHKVLERKDIQAVYIATPLGLHAPIAVEALRSGKHVMCEKMMAYSIEDAKQMCRASRQTGKKLQIGYQRRYDVKYQHAYKLIQEGILGKITHVKAVWNRNASWRRPCPDPKLEELINWRLHRKCSQGLMSELGSHQLDVVNWMLNSTPSAVVAMGGIDYWKDGRDVYDNVQCIFEYPGGIKMQYQSITSNQFEGCSEQIMGDKGTLIFGGKGLLFREPKAEELAWADTANKDQFAGKEGIVLDASKSAHLRQNQAEGTAIEAAAHKDAYIVELEDFFLSIRDGHESLSSGKTALGACVAAIKANEAMDIGRKVEIGPEVYKV